MTSNTKCPFCGKPLAVVAAEETEAPPVPARSIDEALAEDAEFLHVTMGDGVVYYAMKRFIPDDEGGKMIWRRIDAIMSQYGGKWIKEGKESHWEVPK